MREEEICDLKWGRSPTMDGLVASEFPIGRRNAQADRLSNQVTLVITSSSQPAASELARSPDSLSGAHPLSSQLP